jgi:UDP-N-acetylmuramate--alanine ligase
MEEILLIDLTLHKKIHCIGIGGIGLSAIVEILINRGYIVTGSDMKESETTDKLIAKGACIFLGHRAKNVEGADLVIYSSAISKDNPERIRAVELGILSITRAEMLGFLMEEYKTSIAVSGTHGKTTTTSMISLILEDSKKDPTILVGGHLEEISGNVKIGKGEYFITEACEYMDSFLSLKPKIEIILNIDSDHLDYFKDIEHIVRSFKEFTKLIPETGKIIAFDGNSLVHSIINELNNVITFGFNESCTYYVTEIDFGLVGMPHFTVNFEGNILCKIQLAVPGEHNVLNALAAVACCNYLGIEIETIVKTLEAYKGTQRRFDLIGITKDKIKIVDDYAHHPTEIRATLAAAHNIPYNNLWCIFQPHTYTRTMALFNDFADSFELADKIIMADIYAAREKNVYKISSKDLVNEIKRKYPNKEVYYFANFEEIANFVVNNAQSEDLVITMGAGDIYKVAEIIIENDSKY